MIVATSAAWSASEWGAFWTAIGVIVGVVALVFGVPSWRQTRKAARDREVLDMIRKAILGDDPFHGPSPERPSAMDQLKDMRGLMSDQFELTAILLHHISDGHGGEQPPWLSPPKERR